MKGNILIVEDDVGHARLLTLELGHENYITTWISDGKQALDEAISNDYDLILLDIMLPSLNGIELLRRLRAKKNTPVIILTARDQVVDKVSGLDLGANDYVTKPFDIAEVLARIRVHLRNIKSDDDIVFNRLCLSVDSMRVTVDEREVVLTKKEFDLLVYLLKNKNRVVSRKQIVDEVWGFEYYGNTNLVDVYIRYLRAKIEDKFDLKLVTTVRGAGYTVRDDV